MGSMGISYRFIDRAGCGAGMNTPGWERSAYHHHLWMSSAGLSLKGIFRRRDRAKKAMDYPPTSLPILSDNAREAAPLIAPFFHVRPGEVDRSCRNFPFQRYRWTLIGTPVTSQ
jgi:hypothetical protein